MKFEEALVELRKGKIIKCISKGGMRFYLTELNEILMLHTKSYTVHDAMDLIIKGEWFVEEEPGKTFPEVFEDFKKYKKIRRNEWPKNYFVQKDEWLHELGQQDLLATDWEIIE